MTDEITKLGSERADGSTDGPPTNAPAADRAAMPDRPNEAVAQEMLAAARVAATESDTTSALETGAPERVSRTAAAQPAADAATAFPMEDLDEAGAAQVSGALELLDDVELDVKIELGRTEMYIEDVLKLGVGSVVELNKLAGDPVDIFVNERLIARGEVLVLNDNFCVRINDIVSAYSEIDDK